MEEAEVQLHSFLASAQEGGEASTDSPDVLPRERKTEPIE